MTATNEQIERLAELELALDELRHNIADLRTAMGLDLPAPAPFEIPPPTPPPGRAVLPTSPFDQWWAQSQS